jgi:hypothetical protein
MQFILFILDVDYTICVTCIMYQQLWGYKVEEKLYLRVREQKRLNVTGLVRKSKRGETSETYSQTPPRPSAVVSLSTISRRTIGHYVTQK